MDQDVPNNLLEEEFPFTSNLTNYTEQSSQILQAMRTVFVDNSSSMTGGVETVTTPVDMNISVIDGPLDPVFTRPSLQKNRRHGSRHTANERSQRTRKYHIRHLGPLH